MPKKKVWIFGIVILSIVLLGYCGWALLFSCDEYTGTPQHIVIGTSPVELSGLIYIADELGFFTDNGLIPTIIDYESGKAATIDLIKGDLDIASASDIVFSKLGLTNEKILAIACIGESEDHYVIARKDFGISQISDLAGRKIGVSNGTSAEFYLSRFLEIQGTDPLNMIIIRYPSPSLIDFLLSGEVDAIASWDPYVYHGENKLGAQAVVWPIQCGQMMHWVALCKKDYITNHPEIIVRYLRALNEAENYVLNNPDDAKRIIQHRIHADDTYMNRVWPRCHLILGLGQSVIIAMEDEARWMMKNNPDGFTEMPNYLDYLYLDGLEEIRPDLVDIIR